MSVGTEESGIALLLVLVCLLLTSILALEIKSTAALHLRLAENQRDDFLVRQVMRGRLEILKQVLLLDAEENSVEALDDRWADEKYTDISPDEDEEPDESEPVSTEGVSLTTRIEDEARKFNLHNLLVENEEIRAHWEKVFLRLLVLYREDADQGSVDSGQAESLLDKLKDWLVRKDDPDGIPRPATADEARVMITPDELLMVEGFTREILYDLAPPEDETEPIPGLLRYLTVWSAGPVNLNTAEPAMVRALFSEEDEASADSFIEWRQEEAEEQPENLHPDADPKLNAIRSPPGPPEDRGFHPRAPAEEPDRPHDGHRHGFPLLGPPHRRVRRRHPAAGALGDRAEYGGVHHSPLRRAERPPVRGGRGGVDRLRPSRDSLGGPPPALRFGVLRARIPGATRADPCFSSAKRV